MKKIFALFVGIDKYPNPAHNLNGCIKDLNHLHSFLTENYCEGENLFVKRLENEQATYNNIIESFENHLCQAGPNDSVWFHFSGHGSEQMTNELFASNEITGKDQTLVCYDSRPEAGEQGLELADKEMAKLIEKVATCYPAKKNRKKEGVPHIVISYDSCHSGTGTRGFGDEAMTKTRNVGMINKEPRKLDKYYGNYQQHSKIPLTSHIFLGACQNDQKAGDAPHGGAFSTGLWNALSGGGELNYSDLFFRAKTSVAKIRKQQTPQFEVIGQFDPYTKFLEGTPFGDPHLYRIYCEKIGGQESWFVNCGAVHGFPTDVTSPITIEIDTRQTKIKAGLKSVGAQRSQLEIPIDSGLDKTQQYAGKALYLPPDPERILVDGEAAGVQTLIDNWDNSKNIHFLKKTDAESFTGIEVWAENDIYELRDFNSKAPLTKQPIKSPAGTYDKSAVNMLFSKLDKIARWKRMAELYNPKSQICDMFDFQLEVRKFENDVWVNMDEKPLTNSEVKIFADKDEMRHREAFDNYPEDYVLSFDPQVRIKSNEQDLYFYLFYFGSDFSIQWMDVYREVHFRRNESKSTFSMLSILDGLGIGPDAGKHDISFQLKLIATTEPLEYKTLLQVGINEEISTSRGARPMGPANISNDWCAVNMKITVVMGDQEVNENTDAVLANGNLCIKAHKSVKAKASIGKASSDSRSLDPANNFALIDSQHFSLASFGDGSGDRSLSGRNVLELGDLEIDDGADLQSNPLRMELKADAQDNEIWLPIAFDGQNMVVIGDSTIANDGTVYLNIRDLPKVEPQYDSDGNIIADPLTGETGDRSLFKGLKMAFFKFINVKSELNVIHWVDYGADGKAERKKEGLKEKIASSNNILLVIHGIIGDTQNIADGMEMAKDEKGQSLRDQFDLVITYDYENLNTPIEDTARRLHELLSSNGFQENDGKNLTLLAHSMGGLVSRWLVEKEEGYKFVNKLILVGTPNSGSLFGNLTEYKQFAVACINVGINHLLNLVSFGGSLLDKLVKTADILHTLGQMKPGSPFLAELNSSSDPGIPYIIVGGDADQYLKNEKEKKSNGGSVSFLDKFIVGLGGKVNAGDSHDIAVTIESIYSPGIDWVQPPLLVDVDCHHLNYFECEPGLRSLSMLNLNEEDENKIS